MLEAALQKPSSSPPETSLALLSFFRHEYPLGGTVEARFIRFFPTLCDRIFGPILILSNGNKSSTILIGGGSNSSKVTSSSSVGGSGANANTNVSHIKSEELELAQSAWLYHKYQWRSPRGISAGNSRGNPNASRGQAPMSMSTSMPTSYSSPYSKTPAPIQFEKDPVVQLLSPSPSMLPSSSASTTTYAAFNNQQLYTTCFLHILESTETSRQMKNIRLPFPFIELPKSLQESFIRQMQLQQPQQQQEQQQQPQYQEESDKLWLRMHYPPNEQKELVQNLFQHLSSMMHSHSRGSDMNATNNNMRRSPRSSPTFHLTMNNPSMMSSASAQVTLSPQQQFTFDSSTIPSSDVASRLNDTNVMLMLDAWEYYMIRFLRYGVHTPKMKMLMHQHGKSIGNGNGNNNASRSSQLLFGEKVYYHLFKSYCQYYIQHIFEPTKDTDADLQRLEQQQIPPFDQEFKFITIRQQKSDLWIRLTNEFFFKFAHQYPKTKEAVHVLLTRVQNADNDIGLESSFDLSSLLNIPPKWNENSSHFGDRGLLLVRQQYSPPSKQVQKCLKLLIDHLIRDPAITNSCNSISGKIRKNGFGNNQFDDDHLSKSSPDWPLQSAQTILQPSFYNHVRTALRYGPVHVRNSSFYMALDLWLTWLEPWNVVKRKKSMVSSIGDAKELFTHVSGKVTRRKNVGNSPSRSSKRQTQQFYTVYEKPKNNSPSKYSDCFESYIAANLHLYIIPLAIFLRRAREFDFSKEGFQSAIVYVQRVLRVFSPNVVKSLEKLMNHQQSSGNQMNSIVQRHESILGKYCPPCPTNSRNSDRKVWSLAMLQQDMQFLLEEIVLQHRKTVGEQDFFERLGSRVEGLMFKEGAIAEERLIYSLVRQAKVIVHLPQNYEVFPTGQGQGDISTGNVAAQSSDSVYAPERELGGYITEKGRAQLHEGSKICNVMDISFIGDPMYARVKNFEVESLVKFAIFISDWLNKYFSLVTKSSHHIYGDEDEDLSNLLKEQDDAKNISFRFNLRFVADTRNWLLIVILLITQQFYRGN